MPIYFFGNPVAMKSIADVMPFYGEGEFASPRRSTIPMLTLLFHANPLFNEIIRELEMPEHCDTVLEYMVPPPMGQGPASHTDAMVRSGDMALAIEAKWTEPMYQTVGEWLAMGNNPANRQAVLEGWLTLLQQRIEQPLHADQFHDVIYQMLHRAASAAATAEHPSMAYFLFEPLPGLPFAEVHEIHDRLSDLWNLLGGPQAFPFHLVEIETQPLPAYEPLLLLQPGEEATEDAVWAALEGNDPQLAFPAFAIHNVADQ